ncbi:MAG: hypothetical protein JNK82_36320 [Myxococcaceae bacterium]|nr:hypothetical protein [Myxococcaceae bacterium]
MRHLCFALAASIVCLTVQGCSCKGGNGEEDAGFDAGYVDAGPTPCTTQEDCATDAGASVFVCDPQEKVCLPRCMTNESCIHVIGGVCEPIDGICRPSCTTPGNDYCATLDGGIVCDEDKGSCIGKCAQDDDCSALGKTGRRCLETTGKCSAVGVQACNTDPNCNTSPDFDNYCFTGGIQCRCVIEPNDAGAQGVCHRRNAQCTECTTAAQCGTAPHFEPQGDCRTIAGDASGKKYCLYRRMGQCACGYFQDMNGFCAPEAPRTCANPGCIADKDCPGGSVCNTARCACEPRCRWDFNRKEIAAPGCPPGQTCWVDSENLDPQSVYYGSGRCRPPCANDTECQYDQMTNPNGGTNLRCAGEKLTGGGLSEKRCRAVGDCMDNLECTPPPDTQPYLGYCDRGTFTCHDMDCRTGNDPITGTPYKDCRMPFACRQMAGNGTCVLQNCAEQGGAQRACSIGNMCCGDDKTNNDAGDNCPAPSEQNEVGCYRAPSPPYCKSCSFDCDSMTGVCNILQDCDTGVPSYLSSGGTDNCTNGSKSPSCALWPNGTPMPNVCHVYKRDQSAIGQVFYGFCQASTHNDLTVKANGVSAAQNACPAVFSAAWHPVLSPPTVRGLVTAGLVNQNDNYCNEDSDCQLGGADAGRCVETALIPVRMDGTRRKACLCNAGSTGQCPNDPDAGVISFCRASTVPGSETICVSSAVCDVGRPYLFSDAGIGPLFGCGLRPLP